VHLDFFFSFFFYCGGDLTAKTRQRV
jgi:hypothetical protein